MAWKAGWKATPSTIRLEELSIAVAAFAAFAAAAPPQAAAGGCRPPSPPCKIGIGSSGDPRCAVAASIARRQQHRVWQRTARVRQGSAEAVSWLVRCPWSVIPEVAYASVAAGHEVAALAARAAAPAGEEWMRAAVAWRSV